MAGLPEVYPAVYFDGQSAARREVSVSLSAGHLTATADRGAIVFSWPLAGLRSLGRLGPGHTVRLSSDRAPEARLTVEDDGFARDLLAAAPHLAKRFSPGSLSPAGMSALVGVMLALLAGIYYGVPKLAGPVARAWPDSWENSLGTMVRPAVIKDEKECETAAGRDALDALMERLAPADIKPKLFYVSVIDDDMVNAFALPGRQIIIMRGLLDYVEEPDELAGIVAHEIGHVMHRHSSKGLIRAVGLSIFTSLFFDGGSGIAQTLAETGGMLTALSFNREDEREADRSGADILNAAGIGPGGLAAFFDRLAREEEDLALKDFGQYLAFFSTHPPLEERLATVGEPEPGATKTALSEDEWRALRTICETGD